MTDDLIARLRIMANVSDDYGDPYGDAALHRECADALEAKARRIAELEALLSQTNEGYAECIATREDYRARIAELEAALKPFAVDSLMESAPTLSDYRAARAALEKNDD